MINNDKVTIQMADEKYYSLEEISNELKVAYLTVYRWVQDGKLQAHQVGKQYRIAKEEFDAFVDSRKKSTTTPKLQELSKDQLIGMVKQLKRQKKFGLIWEDRPEDVAEQCRKELPVLEQIEDKKILADENGPTNLLIEGDNYHSLSVLNYTHKGKIDVVYIDPPYNTGNKDFKFNDRFVDKEDTYKHSKWLSFISKRLILAKNLLSELGVCFIHIDEHEVAPLLMLCNEMFGEINVEALIWEKTGAVTNTKIIRRIKPTHEYIIVCYANRSDTSFGKVKKIPKWQNKYTNPDNDPRGPYKQGIISNNEAKSRPNSQNYYSVQLPSGRTVTREWYIPKSEYDRLRTDNRIFIPRGGDGVPAIKIFENLENDYYCNSIMTDFGTITSAKEEIGEILGNRDLFDTPKPVKLGKELIRLIKGKDITILDFFAGSGTTGHAVMQLNKEDGGQRRFILCTDNESGIAENICYPRVKKVIDGFSDTKGIPANIRYFKTAFVKKSTVSDDTRNSLVRRSAEVICVRENTFEKITDKPAFKVYRDTDHITGILFDLNSLEVFKVELTKQNLPAHIYVFSLSSDTYDDDFADLGFAHELCPIPESILEVYRKLFRSKKK